VGDAHASMTPDAPVDGDPDSNGELAEIAGRRPYPLPA